VTFRRKAEIWIGGLRFDGEPHTVGALVKVTEPAAQVGIPTVARGDTGWIVAWAQRDTASAPWAVRWRRFKDFSTSGPVRSLPMPPGGPGSRAIAPSIAPLHAGRFLLAWTEGVARHQVRAQVIGANDLPVEAPLAISQPDVDAGQGQIALDTEGRGAVAFLVSKGHAFELAITPLDCEAGLHHP
jgi:hypothetical protein